MHRFHSTREAFDNIYGFLCSQGRSLGIQIALRIDPRSKTADASHGLAIDRDSNHPRILTPTRRFLRTEYCALSGL
jgi:hypothetical protein